MNWNVLVSKSPYWSTLKHIYTGVSRYRKCHLFDSDYYSLIWIWRILCYMLHGKQFFLWRVDRIIVGFSQQKSGLEVVHAAPPSPLNCTPIYLVQPEPAWVKDTLTDEAIVTVLHVIYTFHRLYYVWVNTLNFSEVWLE